MIEGRVIEIEDLANSQGETQAYAVNTSVERVNATSKVWALVFDTTASNTGKFQVLSFIIEGIFLFDLTWYY